MHMSSGRKREEEAASELFYDIVVECMSHSCRESYNKSENQLRNV